MAIHRKILRWLENELFEGNIQLGQDLPSDSEIARAIGVGRSRTREALRTLEDMDLVQLYNGRGKEILVHLSDEPASAASAALRLHMSSSRYPTRRLRVLTRRPPPSRRWMRSWRRWKISTCRFVISWSFC